MERDIGCKENVTQLILDADRGAMLSRGNTNKKYRVNEGERDKYV